VRAVAAGLAGLVAIAGAGCLGSPCGPGEVTVDFVIDGDTFDDVNGTRYRLLLVDAPETTGGKNDCGGSEATDELARLIEGRKIRVSYVDDECVDRYGRTLAWVTADDGTDVNAHVVEQGFGCLYDFDSAGDARLTEFEEYDTIARNGRRGIWGGCNPVTCTH